MSVSVIREHLAANRYFPAIAAAEEILAGDPGHAEALYLRAEAMTRMGHVKAASAAQAAVRAAYRDWRTHVVHGQALLKAGRPREGAAAMREAVAMFPDRAEVLVVFADLSSAAGDAAGARWGYEQALRYAPGHAGARRGLGEVELSTGRVGRAAGHFAAAAGDPASGGAAAFREIVRRLVVAGSVVGIGAAVTLFVFGRVRPVAQALGSDPLAGRWVRGVAGLAALGLLVGILAAFARMPRRGWRLVGRAVRADLPLGTGLVSIAGTTAGLAWFAATGSLVALVVVFVSGLLGWGSRALLT
jgi:tetratricopeptide (TPR) repeat protein